MSLFKLSVSRNDFFFYSVACRARYVSPFDAAPQRQGGWHAGKASAKPQAGIRLEKWRFFLPEQRPALRCQSLAISLWLQKADVLRPAWAKAERSAGKRSGDKNGIYRKRAASYLAAQKNGRASCLYFGIISIHYRRAARPFFCVLPVHRADILQKPGGKSAPCGGVRRINR